MGVTDFPSFKCSSFNLNQRLILDISLFVIYYQ